MNSVVVAGLMVLATMNSDVSDVAPSRITVQGSVVTEPFPVGDPSEWVTSDDYPPEALRANAQGTVAFVLDVDASGKVSDCTVTSSSQSSILDQTTCALLRARATFRPARDASGNPVSGRYSTRVNWVLPLTVKPPRSGVIVTRMTIAPDGGILDCRTEVSGDLSMAPDAARSGPCPATANYQEGYRDGEGRPVARRVIITEKVEVVPVEQAAPSPSHAGSR